MRPWWVWMVIGLTAGVAVLYVANTILYLTPPNPIKAQFLPLIYAIQHPLFAQNWHLFGPNPIRTNYILAVRCRGGARTSSWIDVSTPLMARHHQDRFTPMGKLLRIPQNAILLLLGRSADEWRPLLCQRNANHPVCRGEDEGSKKQREVAAYLITRLTSAVCRSVLTSANVAAIQVRILVHTPPPWSQRHSPDAAGSTRYLTLPWVPAVPW